MANSFRACSILNILCCFFSVNGFSRTDYLTNGGRFNTVTRRKNENVENEAPKAPVVVPQIGPRFGTITKRTLKGFNVNSQNSSSLFASNNNSNNSSGIATNGCNGSNGTKPTALSRIPAMPKSNPTNTTNRLITVKVENVYSYSVLFTY